jgi:hypothetical protein
VLVCSSTLLVGVDAIHLPSSAKLGSAALSAATLLLLTLLLTVCPPPASVMDSELQLLRNVTMASFLIGRLFNLGLYALRYACSLGLRPDTFVVLYKPLKRNYSSTSNTTTSSRNSSDSPQGDLAAQEGAANGTRQLFMTTLREAAIPLDLSFPSSATLNTTPRLL